MKRILIALLLLTLAAPAAAQDWARVFAETDAPESGWQVLVMDPEAPRSERARYRRLPLGSAGLAAWAIAERTGHLLRLTPTSPVWSLLLFTGPSIVAPDLEVVAFFDGEQEPVYLPTGQAVRWGELATGALHAMIRDPIGRLVLMR